MISVRLRSPDPYIPQPARHSGPDPESTQSQSETGTPSSSTPIGDPQSQSDKYQNLIILAHRHGIVPLVYKTLKKLSESNSSLLVPHWAAALPLPLNATRLTLNAPHSPITIHFVTYHE